MPDPYLTGAKFKPDTWGYSTTRLTFDGQTVVADIVYLPMGDASGIVMNGQRVPIGAKVRLTGIGLREDGSVGMQIRGEMNSDPALGTFEFKGALFAGDWGLQAASPFYPVVITTSGQTTRLDRDVTNVVLQFPPVREVNGRLTGRVFYPDGAIVSSNVNVKVSFGNDYVIRTREDGSYDTQMALPAGPVQTPGKLSEFHQPPLYYALAALAVGSIPAEPFAPVDNPFWGYDAYRFGVDNKVRFIHTRSEAFPYQGTFLAAHVARGVSITLWGLSVLVCYLILCDVFKRSMAALGALAFVAFNPQFLFMSGAINNDVIAGLFGSILLWIGVTIIRYGLTTRRSILLALAFAFALMAKFNLAFALPLLELALLIAVWPRRDWRGFIRANLFIVAFVALIAGWWPP